MNRFNHHGTSATDYAPAAIAAPPASLRVAATPALGAEGPVPIDIHCHAEKFERDLEAHRNDERIMAVNRVTIERFVDDARMGRSTRRGARKRLSLARCRKLLATMKAFALHVRVPFEQIDVAEMERIILGIDDGVIGKQNGGQSQRYSAATALDVRKIVKKFYRWLMPDDPARVEELTGWFDTRDTAPELKTFGLSEAQRLARAIGSPQGQALVMMLFDGGFRAGELFNVRLSDVEFRTDPTGEMTCFVRIRVSKTRPRTISLPLATETVAFWLQRHPKGGPIGPDGRIAALDPSAPVLTWTYHYCRKVLADVGRRELGERLYFHRFRHASATFYAKRLSHYQLTARFGWTMGSRAVQRYIDHSGVLADDVAQIIRRTGAAGERSVPAVRPSAESVIEALRQHPELVEALRAALQ